MCICNVSRGRVLQLIAMALDCAGRAESAIQNEGI